MSILYFNNCWFTNIGEAFIDIGAIELLKQLFPGQQIINFSHMTHLKEFYQLLVLKNYWLINYLNYN